MRNIIASMNITLDGNCDHRAGIANPELHAYYTALLNNADTMLYGRTTYELMEDFWPNLIENPTGNKSMDDFAAAIDNIGKVLFSRTRKNIAWRNTVLATRSLEGEVTTLKQQPGSDILVGSPSLIAQLTELNLIDQWQICVHPVISGPGLPLFSGLSKPMHLKLLKTWKFETSDHVVFVYRKD